MLRRVLSAEIDVSIELAKDLGVVNADAGQIEQVLMNLVVNARDAMPQGGKLTIATSNVEGDMRSTPRGVSTGTYSVPLVMLSVRDTGSGMDETTLNHVFEPFFTTKDPGRGTGLGLSTTYGIVKQSGGHVRARSKLGEGSTFEPREEIEKRFGLPASNTPLLCMVSRLTAQKGIDLVAATLDAIVASGARLVILGNGEASLEEALRAGAQRHPERVAVRIGYDEGLSHLLQGGSDAILVPSRFEPCGLTQLYGLRYGCVPVVARVGGLADTVIDANDAALKAGVATGVQFADISAEGLLEAVRKTVQLHGQREVWECMQRAGMRADVGWQTSAAEYAALYRRLVQPKATT